MMNRITRLIYLLMFLFVASCSRDNNLSLLKVTELGSSRLSDTALVHILELNTNYDIHIGYNLSEDTALKYLREEKVDLVIIPNNITRSGDNLGLRTISPLLPRILLILKNNLPENDTLGLKDLFENNTLVYEDLSRLDSLFFDELYMSFGIDESKVIGINVNSLDMNKWADSSFVFVGLTHLHNPTMKRLLDNGAEFFSLDKIEELGKGSSAEGFTLDYSSASTFILPKAFYKGKPHKPVLTVSILDILICRESMDKNTVYKIAESLVFNKSQLVQYDNIYRMLPRDFRKMEFVFPFHEGTQAFLDRDEPPIWSLYATFIWPVVSMLAIFAGVFASLHKSVKQRQKHRIEVYYGALLKIRNRAVEEPENKGELLSSLGKIRVDAFNALGKNKLVANQSFAIFMTLYDDIKQEIINNSDT